MILLIKESSVHNLSDVLFQRYVKLCCHGSVGNTKLGIYREVKYIVSLGPLREVPLYSSVYNILRHVKFT